VTSTTISTLVKLWYSMSETSMISTIANTNQERWVNDAMMRFSSLGWITDDVRKKAIDDMAGFVDDTPDEA